jgi:uncharacterized membrane protein YfcA
VDLRTGAGIGAATALAALVKGTLGLGFPPVATPLVAALVGAQTAVVAISIPSFLQNVTQCWAGRAHLPEWRPLLPLLAGLTAGSVGGAYLLTVLPVRATDVLVGLVIVGYVTLAAFRIEPRVPAALWSPMGGLVGLVAGLIGGATGIYGPLLATYFAVLRLDKDRFAATISLVFFVAQVPQLVTLAVLGLYTGPRLFLSALMLPPVALGFALGTVLRARFSQRSFTLAVRLALLVVGLRLVFEGLR